MGAAGFAVKLINLPRLANGFETVSCAARRVTGVALRNPLTFPDPRGLGTGARKACEVDTVNRSKAPVISITCRPAVRIKTQWPGFRQGRVVGPN